MFKKGIAFLLIAGFVMFGFTAVAQAEWPDRPISMIVAYPPGGATDFQARIATMLAANEEFLGAPIVIINRAGAGGQVGWNWMIERGSKDGYTMTAYNVPHFIAQSIVYDTRYDIHKFEAVANWGADPAVLIVPKDSPYQTLEELLVYGRANPGRVTVNGAGMFVGHHIAALQMAEACDVELTYIPEAGGVPAMQSVIGGHVISGFNNLSDAFRAQDRVTVLAVADLERHEFLPDVPTFKELGYDVDDSSVNFRGVAFPKGVPQEVIDKAAEAFPKMFDAPRTQKQMRETGSPVRTMGRDEVTRMFEERNAFLSELLKDLVQK